MLPNLAQISDKVTPVAIADPVLERARSVADTYGIPKAFGTLEEMLDGAELDAVINLTPIPVHGETCRKILSAGKHLATEKPLATTMADANDICDLAAQRGLTVVCAPYNMLYPDRMQARRLIRHGAIGKVAFARVRSSHGGPASGNWPLDPTWFYQKGSGPLYDMGVYGIHEITGLLGPAKRVVAFAGITEPVRTVRGGPFKGKKIEVTADDNVLMMLDFGASTFAVVDGTFNVNAARGPKVEIYGREGTINIAGAPYGGEGPPLEIFQLDAVPGLGGWITPTLREVEAQTQRAFGLHRAILADHLADCVATGETPMLNVDHARHILEIMLMAEESSRTGQAVPLTTTFELPDREE
ncbi:Gfo/Idh/MocA family protein [Fodinicola feengrottensis]|uniref:Gfo/Idh/MocA family protein n=1 Tax=Fodinicola feengrottensis TaxID=435914 RepID=UPI002442B1CD|nr:Gfo/Idh/MocA family oxidoreductase [Fodinicola feengrottensis]